MMDNNEYNLERIGKRMPYTTPDGFFGQMEANILKGAREEKARGKHRRLRFFIGGAVAAAAVALAFVLNIGMASQPTVTVGDIDQAFCQLSADDQAFLMAVYQNDVFDDEQQ